MNLFFCKNAKLRVIPSAMLIMFGVSAAAHGQMISPLSQSERATFAQGPVQQAVQLQSIEYVIPELVIGGAWTSSIRITNPGTQPVSKTVVFFVDNTGKPMLTTFRASDGSVVTDFGFSYSLNPGGSVEATFLGGTDTVFGQAVIGCNASGCGTHNIYGEVTLRNHASTRPDFESVFPFEEPFGRQYMLFDGRNGLTTLLYLNSENVSASQLAIDIVDTNGVVRKTVNLNFTAQASQIWALDTLAPETAGIEGTLIIRSVTPGGLFTATGLRINPTNSFTPLRAFVPAAQ
jgi:hypothetical protein